MALVAEPRTQELATRGAVGGKGSSELVMAWHTGTQVSHGCAALRLGRMAATVLWSHGTMLEALPPAVGKKDCQVNKTPRESGQHAADAQDYVAAEVAETTSTGAAGLQLREGAASPGEVQPRTVQALRGFHKLSSITIASHAGFQLASKFDWMIGLYRS